LFFYGWKRCLHDGGLCALISSVERICEFNGFG
jgi:hypothetical protein